jgi:hypothetical protein
LEEKEKSLVALGEAPKTARKKRKRIYLGRREIKRKSRKLAWLRKLMFLASRAGGALKESVGETIRRKKGLEERRLEAKKAPSEGVSARVDVTTLFPQYLAPFEFTY